MKGTCSCRHLNLEIKRIKDTCLCVNDKTNKTINYPSEMLFIRNAKVKNQKQNVFLKRPETCGLEEPKLIAKSI